MGKEQIQSHSLELLREIAEFRIKYCQQSQSTTHIITLKEFQSISNRLIQVYKEIHVVKKTESEIPKQYNIYGYKGQYVELTINN